jgi:hypothetical protein
MSMSLEDILSTQVPKNSGTTLLKIFRQDHADLKKLAQEMGLPMVKLITLMVHQTRQRFEKAKNGDKRP